MLHVRSSDCADQLLGVTANHITHAYGSLQQGKKALGSLVPAFGCSSQKMTCVISTHNPLAKISHLPPPKCQEKIASHKHRERGKPDVVAHRMPLCWAGSETQETGTQEPFLGLSCVGASAKMDEAEQHSRLSLTFRCQGGIVWSAWRGSGTHQFSPGQQGTVWAVTTGKS